MALKYVVKKTVFGFDKTKTVKYVARPLLAGTVGYSALCDQVTKVGMAPRGVVKMVTDGLIDAIKWNLENHLSVKLGDFGTFRPAFGSKSQDSEEAVNAEALRHRKIIFTPGAYFKDMLSEVSIQKFEIPKTDETGGGSEGGGGSDRPEIE
ncbi:DNA-binding protein [Parabacteroides faecis]|uniref:HU family DNA-binding protein n=1 Tax=Parabacteroides faecis TaxID=1217282 RepID=UPI002164BDB2|nr:DNA-binding protein [Parabacteroides faecis]MCS2891336.1 DNA-binding protein [Parabacteroides faecis]UVQ45012.1 DNA-binding protein [Parabacteroides faecis]